MIIDKQFLITIITENVLNYIFSDRQLNYKK